MRITSHIAWLAWIGALALAPSLAAAAAAAATAATPAPITVPFDHLTTGFELDGVHRDLPCESCHLNAVFKGTPTDCGTCHTAGSPFNATPKTATHIPSTNNCVACHNTIAFRPDVHFDHAEVLGSCVSCHNGTLAQGEGPTHPQTSQDCGSCHTVISWSPAKAVDHSQIPLAVAGFCIVCHNGTAAAGQNPGHIATTLECGDCHLTTTWLGATFDHVGITSGCVSCHDGSKAVGKQGNHMPTTNLCENCHTTGIGTATPAWTPSIFDHTQMTVSTCQTCHSGTVKISTGFVSGQPTNHVPPIPSTIDCGVCHGNVPTAETWTVLAATIPVLHSGLNVNNCLLCHAGESFAGVPAPYIPMSTSGVSPTHATPLAPPHIPILAGVDCSSCHAAAYNAGGFGPATAMSAAKHAFVSATCDTCHEAGASFYVGTGTALQTRPADHTSASMAAPNDCSGCHETTDWNSSALPAGHMPNPGNQGCSVCHTALPGNYTTLASNAVMHTGITSNCSQCHGSTVTTLTFYNNFTVKSAVLSPAHIPFLSGTDCVSCHTPTTYAAGNFGGTTMSAAKHAFVPTTCDLCHEAGLNFYPGAGLNLQGRPADHLSSGNAQEVSGDCSGCHTTTDWTSNVMPAGHMPNPANQACTVCHTSVSTSYSVLASNAVLHTGISTNCAQCHGSTTTTLTFYNNFTIKSAVLSPVHIPILSTADCSACHSSTTYAVGGFAGMTMTAATHAYVPTTCDTCHEIGDNFYPSAAALNLQARPNSGTFNHLTSSDPNQATGDCSLCHSVTSWASNVPPAGHMPNPAGNACAVCHTTASSTPGTPDYTQYSLAGVHTGSIVGSCAVCHSGSSWVGSPVPIMPKPSSGLTPAHIPVLAGADCSGCHITTGITIGGFANTSMSAAKHAFVATTCDTCHEAGLSFYPGAALNLQGRPSDHTGSLAAPNDCKGCHETTDWNSTALPAGHMPNPGSQGCNVCHTAAPTNYTTLATNTVLHTGITSGCSACHGYSAALTFYNNFTPKSAVLTPAHIPLLAASTPCESCHSATVFTSFGPMNMTAATHAFVASTCDTCHEAGLSFTMGSASPALQGRPTDHTSGQMVSPNDCSICHTTANWNSTALPAGHMPNPGSQNCTVCHTTAPADYSTATLATNAILHTGISSGCITCHGGPAGALTFYNNFTPKSAVLSPVHIPTSTTPCEDCHSKTVFTAFSGTSMTSAEHTSMFAVIGSTCDACHNAVTPALSFYGVTNLTTRPSDHNSGSKKTNDCSSCHSPKNWDGGAQKKATAAASATRQSTIGTVVSHPVQSATGTTIASGPASGVASRLSGAAGRAVSHAGVTSNCVSCHNGTLATGKGPGHLPTNNQCENCHTTMAWLPARFDHQGISAACSSCHNGILAAGKPTQHVQTLEDCGACHSTLTWTPARFTHLGISGSCQSCHNGVTATGKPLQHLSTTLDCGTCHNTQDWAQVLPSAVAPPKIQLPAPRGNGHAVK